MNRRRALAVPTKRRLLSVKHAVEMRFVLWLCVQEWASKVTSFLVVNQGTNAVPQSTRAAARVLENCNGPGSLPPDTIPGTRPLRSIILSTCWRFLAPRRTFSRSEPCADRADHHTGGQHFSTSVSCLSLFLCPSDLCKSAAHVLYLLDDDAWEIETVLVNGAEVSF